VAFAIGPVMQGTLGSAVVTGVATLPRCESTQDGKLPTSGSMFDQYQASIFLSAFKPSGASDETLQALNTNCDTGNCEWPTFSSLALCSNTTDMSSQVVEGHDGNGTLRNLTLPNGLYISDIEPGIVSYNGSSTLPTINYNNWRYDPVARFSVMYYHFGGDGNNYRAAEGVMYWCVQAYHATVKNTVLASEITSTWYPTELNTSAVPMILSPPQEQWKALGLTKATNFIVGDYSYGGVPEINLDFINLSLDWNNTFYSPPRQLDAIANLMIESFPDFFTYLAGAMSNRFRGSVCTLTVDGHMNLVTVLQIQWWYLVLPIATTILVCVFLAIVILESRRHDVKVWKNNILVTLFHGLSEDLRSVHKTSHVLDVPGMEHKAKQVVVCLKKGERDDDNGLVLKQ
jgi:hypothetical protein